MPNSIVRCIICKSKAKLFEKISSYEKTINKEKILFFYYCSNLDCRHIFQKKVSTADLNDHYKYGRVNTISLKCDQQYLDDRIEFIKSNTKLCRYQRGWREYS